MKANAENRAAKAELDAARAGFNAAHARRITMLEELGDALGAKQKAGLFGLDAIHLHLIEKHHWLPRDVRTMSSEDLLLAMAPDMKSTK